MIECTQFLNDIEYVVTYIDGHAEVLRFKSEVLATHFFQEEAEWINSYIKI